MRLCSRDACQNKHYARDLCRKHYSQAHLSGCWARYNARDDVKAKKRECAVTARSADPVAYAARRHATYMRRKEKHAETTRKWRLANPERARELDRENHARRKAYKAGATVTAADYRAILAEYGMNCHICEGVIETRSALHFDHVIPLARGGPHVPENIRPAHAICNTRKGARLAS